jgi:site-specific DNA recombinase
MLKSFPKEQELAAIYARVSSEEQVRGYSIQAQLRACREWAAKNGYKVAKEYLEEGQSAFRNLEKREALKELLAETVSKQRSFDLIIVHKLDRLFRDTLESSTARAILKREQVRLVSVTEPMVGSDTPEDFFMEHLLVGMAEFYSRNLSREIIKGLKQRARQGHLVFRPPFGYRKEVIDRQEGHKRTRIISRPIVDEKAAPLVQRIFDLYDRGMGGKAIAMALNGDGYRTNQSRLFGLKFILRVLRNRAYIGILDYNFHQNRGPREPIVVPGFYPPIIDEALFARAQEQLKKQADNWQNSYTHRTSYLLSRLVVCDQCGHHYLGTSAKSGRYNYYSCRTYIQKGRAACNAPLLNKEKLEITVLDQIQEQILSEDNVRRYIDLVLQQTRQSQIEPSAEEQALNLTITDVEAKIRRWEQTLERGLLPLEDAAHRIKELRAERGALLKKKIALEKKSQSDARVVSIPTALMKSYVRNMQERLRERKIGSKKEFLREIVKEVRVRGNTIQLTYKLPLASRTSPSEAKTPRKGGFLTLCNLVEPMGVEPTASRVRF